MLTGREGVRVQKCIRGGWYRFILVVEVAMGCSIGHIV